MKKNLFSILMLAILFVAASCTKDEVEEPTLTLSETATIVLPKAASEKAVTVTTNQTEWTVMSNVNWIELVQSGTTLTIKTAENLETTVRKGEVMVMAGGLGRKLMVEQAASDITIVTIPDKLELDQWGGKYQFDVNANTKDWTVSSDAEWVKVTAKQFKSEVVIEVAENTKREARVAKLTLVGSGNKGPKEFIITQSGIMYYILPYFGFNEKASAIKTFEFARKSELVRQPDGLFNTSLWEYETKSEAFDLIRYNVPKDVYKEVVLFTKDAKFFETELEGFKKFLKDNGFEDKGSNVFLHPTKNIQATINDKATDPNVSYKFIPKQPQAYKTFDAFPYGFTDFTADRTKVEAYETANGGTFIKDKSNEKEDAENHYLFFDVKKNPLLARAYFIENAAGKPKILIETAQYYTNMNLAFWDYNGEFIFTNEFLELMKKEGFVYEGFRTWHIFKNAAKKLGVAMRWVKYSDMDVPVLDIHVFSTATAKSVDYITKKDINNRVEVPGLSKDAKFSFK